MRIKLPGRRVAWDAGRISKDKGFRPRALGEIAIRCADVARMAALYGDVIGLTRLSGNQRSDLVFFRIAEGFGGHTSILAPFGHDAPARPDSQLGDGGAPVTGARSSLHHIALSLPFEEQDAVIAWYKHLGQPCRVEHTSWVGWRGIFTEDPEGKTVELVAYHPSLLAADQG